MSKKLDELEAFIDRGSRREKILKCLKKSKTPSKIQKETEISFSGVSDTLKLFVMNGIAKCKNPEAKTGRKYYLTKNGIKILEKFD